MYATPSFYYEADGMALSWIVRRLTPVRARAAALVLASMSVDRILRDVKERCLTFLEFALLAAVVSIAASGQDDTYALQVVAEHMGPRTLPLVTSLAVAGLLVMMVYRSHGVRTRVAAVSDLALSIAVATGGLLTGQLVGTTAALLHVPTASQVAMMLWMPFSVMGVVTLLSIAFVATRGDDEDEPYGWILDAPLLARVASVVAWAVLMFISYR